jgi:hypothetical protein
VYNATALACEASFYQATTLKLSIFDYIIACMETMLESGLLDEMHEDVLLDLSQHITSQQLRKLSLSRSGKLVNAAMEKHKEWLALQDIPAPRIRQPWRWKPRSPTLSPSDPTVTPVRSARKTISPNLTPETRATSVPTGDEMFAMDDDIPTTPLSGSAGSRPMTPLDLSAGGQAKGAVWRSKAVEAEKVDLRSVMAEAAASKTPLRPTASPFPSRTPPPATARPPLQSFTSTPTKSPALAKSSASTGGVAGAQWRPLDRSKSSFAAVQAQQAASPKAGPSTPANSRPSGSLASPLPSAVSGSVITPVKMQQPLLGQRKQS